MVGVRFAWPSATCASTLDQETFSSSEQCDAASESPDIWLRCTDVPNIKSSRTWLNRGCRSPPEHSSFCSNAPAPHAWPKPSAPLQSSCEREPGHLSYQLRQSISLLLLRDA